MKKERSRLKNCMEIKVRKGLREQIQSLAVRQNMDLEQASETLVRRGLETYLAEQVVRTGTSRRSKK